MTNNNKFLVLVPTYNEIGSIGNILDKLTSNNFRVLVIDDNSPDGTAEYVENLRNPLIQVLIRPEKNGLGNAYKAGIRYALVEISKFWNFDYLISMDADGSHQVSDLVQMTQLSDAKPDALILGSRWILGGGIRNWSKYRIKLSKAGTWYAKRALKMDTNDLTGGFRIYPRKFIEKLDLDKIQSNGYSYQIEMAFALKQLGCKISECPITFVERETGVSKMSYKIVLEAIWKVTKLGLGLRLRPNADKLHYVK
jgi:dolichol-phosphate mannosyltransferase